jgi:hypothetical protein
MRLPPPAPPPVVQPGGSVRDTEVIAAADEHGLAMVFTGRRHFRHVNLVSTAAHHEDEEHEGNEPFVGFVAFVTS